MQFDAIGRELRAEEMPAVEAFRAKYCMGAPLPSREEVQREQEQVRKEVFEAVMEGRPYETVFHKRVQAHQQAQEAANAGVTTLPPLLPLAAFAEAQPGQTWRPEQPPITLYLRDIERIIIQVETSTTNLGYHLWRDEELGKQGIDAQEEDAKAFAQGLVAALAPRLSLFDLEFVVQAFKAELERAEAERQAAIAEHAARQSK